MPQCICYKSEPTFNLILNYINKKSKSMQNAVKFQMKNHKNDFENLLSFNFFYKLLNLNLIILVALGQKRTYRGILHTPLPF